MCFKLSVLAPKDVVVLRYLCWFRNDVVVCIELWVLLSEWCSRVYWAISVGFIINYLCILKLRCLFLKCNRVFWAIYVGLSYQWFQSDVVGVYLIMMYSCALNSCCWIQNEINRVFCVRYLLLNDVVELLLLVSEWCNREFCVM